MIRLNRTTVLWTFFIISSIIATFFSVRYFSYAFPLVNVHISMSRSSALDTATTLAKQYNLGPSSYKQAALFATDHNVQTYVELNAGGAQAYNSMVTGTLYSPYTWQVRHVKSLETNELVLIFKPDGTFYGFEETIAEKTPGAALSAEQAELIAQQQAETMCQIHISEYKRVELSKEIRPNGRIDHIFVYERPNLTIGKATYRLRLVVSGDKLTGLTHFVKVPDEFYNQYKEMRSANNTLAQAAQIAMLVIYILCIGIVGLMYLIRRKYLLWKAPLICGLFIALLNAGAHLSQFPLFWFSYQTTSPAGTFVFSSLLQIFLNFIFMWALYTFVFMVAESLTRIALPTLGQFWKSWTRSSGSSWTTLGNTLAAYVLVPLVFADVILFYRITTHYFGWWTPSEQLTDPNVLASYLPWLNAVAPSLSAGFLEECLFRAFPLAAALLLGRRYGKKNWWLAGAFILQVLIFGAAHANYPAQPAYARLVELIVFSTLMGIIYLKKGLLVGIITHTLYDLVWFALPIFISCSHYAWIQKSIVIILGLLPIAIILVRRLQYGHWHNIDLQECNCTQLAAIPESSSQEQHNTPVEQEELTAIKKIHTKLLGIATITSLILWGTLTQFTPDAQPLIRSKEDAEKTSIDFFEKHGFAINKDWTPLCQAVHYNSPITHHQLPETSSLNQHKFIWQEGGKNLYRQLLGSYLEQPHWNIRYLRFNGSVQERSEEYFVSIDNTQISRMKHVLPEDLQGQELNEQDARAVAQKALLDIYGINAENCTEISAISSKKPHRLDWQFIFAEKNQPPLKEGQTRIALTIAGNELADYCKYIHVPEEWVRTQAMLTTRNSLINIVCTMILLALVISISISLFRRKKQAFHMHYWTAFTALLGLFLLQNINSIPSLLASILNAQEPYWQQIFRLSGGLLVGIIIMALLYPLFISFVSIRSQNAYNSKNIFYGIALGICWAGLFALLKYFAPSMEPVIGNEHYLNYYSPCLAIILERIGQFLTYTIGTLFFIQGLNTFNKSRYRYVLQISLIMLFSFLFLACQPIITISHLLISSCLLGICMTAAYYTILCHMPTITPWATATLIALSMLQHGILLMIPAALLYNIIGIIIIFIVAWFWYKKMFNSIE